MAADPHRTLPACARTTQPSARTLINSCGECRHVDDPYLPSVSALPISYLVGGGNFKVRLERSLLRHPAQRPVRVLAPLPLRLCRNAGRHCGYDRPRPRRLCHAFRDARQNRTAHRRKRPIPQHLQLPSSAHSRAISRRALTLALRFRMTTLQECEIVFHEVVSGCRKSTSALWLSFPKGICVCSCCYRVLYTICKSALASLLQHPGQIRLHCRPLVRKNAVHARIANRPVLRK